MAIRSSVLRGFGNDTFDGTIPLVVTRGFTIGDATTPELAFGVRGQIDPAIVVAVAQLDQTVLATGQADSTLAARWSQIDPTVTASGQAGVTIESTITQLGVA